MEHDEDMTKTRLIDMAQEMQKTINANARSKRKIRNALYDLHEYATGIYWNAEHDAEGVKAWADMILGQIEIIKEALNDETV